MGLGVGRTYEVACLGHRGRLVEGYRTGEEAFLVVLIVLVWVLGWLLAEHGRDNRTRESEGRRERAGGHHVGGLLALCGVGGGDGVDNGLGFFLANLCNGFIWLAVIQLLGLAVLLRHRSDVRW